jgi:hypothetical protein
MPRKHSPLDRTSGALLQASERARSIDGTSDVPRCPGTRLYKLIDMLQRSDSIDLLQATCRPSHLLFPCTEGGKATVFVQEFDVSKTDSAK